MAAMAVNQTARASIASVMATISVNNSFIGQCIDKLVTATDYTNWSGVELVDEYGFRLSDFTNAAWGITYKTCSQYCSPSQLDFPFDYGTFSNSMTNYLLPWLALTAQLPYETGDPWSNMTAFCMAVGSPVLITYSLTLTILNRSWARGYFKTLLQKSGHRNVQLRAPKFDKKVSAAQFLVQEAQQVPLRCSQERGWLASLIVLPKNIVWWERLESRLKGTRRGFSPSLIAQMGLAIIAWLLTVVAAFIVSIGDPYTALQISSSSLYVWLVPVIIGWILVGTQISDHSIDDALQAHPAHRARGAERFLNGLTGLPQANGHAPHPEPFEEPTTQPEGDHITRPQSPAHESNAAQSGVAYSLRDFSEKSEQKGIEVRGGLSPQVHNQSGNLDASQHVQQPQFHLDNNDLVVQNWAGFSIAGDEEKKGPTFNYARLFTWWQVVSTIHGATSTTLRNIDKGQLCEGVLENDGRRPSDWQGPHDPMLADREAISRYCGLDKPGSCKQYPEWHELPAELYRRIAAASAVAILVQWGTAGAPIMIAFMTPTIGVGCRSGSYLLYAGMSTFAWMLLVLGSLCSHQAMLIYQRHILTDPQRHGLRRPSVPRVEDAREYDRPLSHTMICAAAVIFRIAGKALCIINTIWLLLTSIMEFIGGFENCWCQGVVVSRGEQNGYILLFKTAHDLERLARPYWEGGLAMTVLVVILSVLIFSMGTWKPDAD